MRGGAAVLAGGGERADALRGGGLRERERDGEQGEECETAHVRGTPGARGEFPAKRVRVPRAVQVQETITRIEGIGGARRFRIAHAEDPAHPGTALCGTKLNGQPTSASAERCVVCQELARRSFFGR